MKRTFIFIFAFITFFAGRTAYADSSAALAELLKALEKNGTITKEVSDLVMQVANQGKTEVEKMVKEEVAAATKDQPKITLKDKFEVKDQEGNFSFRVGGRVQADAAYYDEDNLKHTDGTEMRRARLFVQGTMWTDWQYKLQYDFTGSGSAGINDAYIKYAGLPGWNFTFGHFKQPFSLQNMTSSKYITFTERGLPHLFTPGRGIGFAAGKSGKNWGLNAGLFGEGIDGASSNEDEGYAFTGRGTYAPILEKSQHLHLGASVSYRRSGSIDSVSFSDRPESHVTNIREVNSGSFNADANIRAVAEAAYTLGRGSLQGEYYLVDVDRDGGSDLNFDGYYVEGSWFLTSDTRNYSGSKGSYSKIKPSAPLGKGGIGAWQLAARFSHVDLNDADISGGEADNLSFGINWFPINNIRMSANYVKVLDVDGGPSDADEPGIFNLRGQIEF